jgi:hypothetical protein
MAVKIAVLIAVEQIQYRACHPGQPAEIGDGGRVHINAADTTVPRLQVSNAGFPAIETGRATAQAAKQVKVSDFYFFIIGLPVGHAAPAK